MHSTLPHAVLGALACPDAARFVPERHAVMQVSSERNIVRNKFSSYNLSAYGPNGFVRYFKGSVGTNAAALDVHSRYGIEEGGSIRWRITNVAENGASVSVLDAYTGDAITRFLRPHETFEDERWLSRFYGWYDLIVTVAEDPSYRCESCRFETCR
jgi:hypothetical protein